MILALVLLLSLPFSALADDLIGVEFVKVHDGDTLIINLPALPPVFGHHLGVRLRGIDTPELHGKCEAEARKARAARDYVIQRLSQAKAVALKDPARDKYFRLDVTVMVDGVNLNQDLIQRGYARPYTGQRRQGWCS